MKNKTIWQIIPLVFASLLILSLFSLATTNRVEAQGGAQSQNDAIGIRVIPNPNHYSVFRWYESQGFSGSPQALTVDGYEALRDGRTVYINAAHVLPEQRIIYTNIYLISYNQDQSNLTTDILGQIIAHWKFNDNLADEEATCSISAVKCSSNVDCPSSQTCSLSSGTCELEEEKSCQVDNDCPTNYFCSSVKAKIIRDLSRVGKIEELREALAKYRDNNGRYPQLGAGTYLSGASTSLWPSWQETFLPSLGAKQSFLDPINRLGACTGYDAKTCWNKDNQSFIYPKDGVSLKLPNDSYAMVYATNDSGSEYNLCAVMESRDSSDPQLGYSLSPNDPQGSNCVTATGIISGGNANNRAPEILDTALRGISGLEYNGFVRARDPDNDPLTWSISTRGALPAWSETPYIKGTSDPYQKKIYASRAGDPGTYPITITVTDDKGSSVSKTDSIVIREASTLAEASEYVYRLDPVDAFNYSFYVSGASSAPQYNLKLISGPDVLNYSGIRRDSSADGINRQKINYRGVFSTSLAFNEDTESLYSVSAGSGDVSQFIVKVKVDRPILDFSCNSDVRIGHDYSCFIGSSRQGNHTISYSATNLPTGLSLVESGEKEDGSYDYHIEGMVNQKVDAQKISISAVNEYQTTSTKTFTLNVNTYCGDGILQVPNSEGRGGMYNNGYEACDGGNVATNPKESSRTKQYACNTPAGASTPYPIPSYDYCVFKSPLDGGGYCGDSYCQKDSGEDKASCPFDCDPKYTGSDIVLGDDNSSGDTCTNNNDCLDGYTCRTGVCEANCWNNGGVTENKIRFLEGDGTIAGVNYGYWTGTKKSHYTFPTNALNKTTAFKECFPVGSSSTLPSPTYNTYKRGGDPDLLEDHMENGELVKGHLQNCTYVRVDNPLCIYEPDKPFSSSNINCPAGYSNLKVVGRTDSNSNDRCKDRNGVDNGCGGINPWCGRFIFECSKSATTCVGDPCAIGSSSTLNGTINANRECVANNASSNNTGNNSDTCFQKKEASAIITFKEGDPFYGSAAVPVCKDTTMYTALNQVPQTGGVYCPTDYDTLKMVGMTSGIDTCKNEQGLYHLNSVDPRVVCNGSNCNRYIYKCMKTESVSRCIGDPCKPENSITLSGIINSNGDCIAN